MRTLIFAAIMAMVLSGCETNMPRTDLPISKYEGDKVEIIVITGYIDDKAIIALDKSNWKLADSIPGYNSTYPKYVLVREKN